MDIFRTYLLGCDVKDIHDLNLAENFGANLLRCDVRDARREVSAHLSVSSELISGEEILQSGVLSPVINWV